MDNHTKDIFGSFIQAVGTIESAIGSTPIEALSKRLLNNLTVKGNVLQAVGCGLSADAQETISFEKIGDEVQSIGNVTVIIGLLLKLKNQQNKKLVITGNGLQALGALISLTDEFNDRTQSGRNYNIIGNALQSIGNSMQAVSGIYDLQENKGEDAEILDILGSWIQAVGSIFSLVGQVLEERDEAEKHQPE